MAFDLKPSQQIRIPKAAEAVARRIRRSIIQGELKSGDILPKEADLIASFQVSRSTVREAIRILETEGLLRLGGTRGGARVKAPTADGVAKAAGLALQANNVTLQDVYGARALLEPPAARIAAEERPEEASSALRAQILEEYRLEETRIDGAPALRARAVADFHRILLEQCGNFTVALMGQALQEVVVKHLLYAHRYQRAEVRASYPPLAVGYRSHEKLADLIAAGKGVEAEAHWREHMERSSQFWLSGIAGTSILDVLD